MDKIIKEYNLNDHISISYILNNQKLYMLEYIKLNRIVKKAIEIHFQPKNAEILIFLSKFYTDSIDITDTYSYYEFIADIYYKNYNYIRELLICDTGNLEDLNDEEYYMWLHENHQVIEHIMYTNSQNYEKYVEYLSNYRPEYFNTLSMTIDLEKIEKHHRGYHRITRNKDTRNHISENLEEFFTKNVFNVEYNIPNNSFTIYNEYLIYEFNILDA